MVLGSKGNYIIWLVVSTHLKNISQNGNLPQIFGVKIKHIWNHTYCSSDSFLKTLAKQLLAQSCGNGMGQWHAIRGFIAGITKPPMFFRSVNPGNQQRKRSGIFFEVKRPYLHWLQKWFPKHYHHVSFGRIDGIGNNIDNTYYNIHI